MEMRMSPTVLTRKGELKPRKGALAICRNGVLGVILGATVKDGRETWVGQKVFTSLGGTENVAWQSVDPHVVGYITESLFV